MKEPVSVQQHIAKNGFVDAIQASMAVAWNDFSTDAQSASNSRERELQSEKPRESAHGYMTHALVKYTKTWVRHIKNIIYLHRFVICSQRTVDYLERNSISLSISIYIFTLTASFLNSNTIFNYNWSACTWIFTSFSRSLSYSNFVCSNFIWRVVINSNYLNQNWMQPLFTRKPLANW